VYTTNNSGPSTDPCGTEHTKSTRSKVVLPNINRTQVAKITTGIDGMVPSAAAGRCLQRARYNALCSRTDHSVAAEGDGGVQRVFCPW